MISKKLAKKLLDESLKTGADFAELYLEETQSHLIQSDNDKIENIGSFFSRGIGVRLLKENRSVYGYTNEINEKKIMNLIHRLSLAFKGPQIATCKDFVDKHIRRISKIQKSYFDTRNDEKIAILNKVSTAMKDYSPLVIRTLNAFSANKKKVEIYNSEGLHAKDNKERVILILRAYASENRKTEFGFNSIGSVEGMSRFDNVDFQKEAIQAAQEAVSLLSAKECPSGKMTVIVSNGFGGVLFHEACGHSLEATAVARGLSVFSNRLGEQIASPIVNAYDDATLLHRWGTENMDDEGNLTQKNCLIKNGVLSGYLIDNFNGRRMHATGNGTCRRQNYKYEPTSRMNNTYIDNGTSTVDEIIKNTKLGLYAKHLGGGSVSPTTGEFEFACSVAYIVRDGKIAEQVRGATLIGTGEEVLKNIDMIANDLDFDYGYCGSASGDVPVATGQPTIRIKEITVGGSGGKLE